VRNCNFSISYTLLANTAIVAKREDMDESLLQLLTELEQFGRSNDGSVADKARHMLNITHDTGEFLSVLIHAMHAQSVLEVGTSNGYSTLWLANAAGAIGGKVTTIELSKFKVDLALQNFSRSGLTSLIDLIKDNAGIVLANLEDSSFDLIFLDSDRNEYPNWWPDIKRMLRIGGLLVADNATSHPEQLAPFIDLVKADPEYITSLAPIGNGEFLAARI